MHLTPDQRAELDRLVKLTYVSPRDHPLYGLRLTRHTTPGMEARPADPFKITITIVGGKARAE